MSNQDLVSVIIPIYNAEKYLEEAISSVQSQTYSNLEIICVDDCSTDDSLKILNDLNRDDNRIKILRNGSNKGIAHSLNKAISHSSGDIIVRMDADDVSLPERVESQVDYLNDNNVDFVGSTVLYVTEAGKEMGQSHYFSNIQIKRYIKYRSTLAHPTWALYKEVYGSLGGYRNVAPAEDYDFLYRAIRSGVRISMLNKPLLKFRTQSTIGGTALNNGLVQRRMFNYVKSLNNGMAEYSDNEVQKVKMASVLSKRFFYYSQRLYYQATLNKHQGNYVRLFIYLLLSIVVSPYQLQFVYRAFIVKVSGVFFKI